MTTAVAVRAGVAPAVRSRTAPVPWMVAAVLSWGALSFGAVYPWAYWPLAAGCLTAGLLAIVAAGRGAPGASRHTTVALVVLAAAILAQLAPLPGTMLDALTPATSTALRQLDPAFAGGLTTRHAVSLSPAATWTGLALYASFALLIVGTSRWFSIKGTSRTVESLCVLGTVLALIGIVQKPLFVGKIYGFWTPQMGTNPYGPFVNKNHFAGWMLLAVPLLLGLVCAGIERRMRGTDESWRERLLWFSSPDANRLILIASAAVVMALSLVLTMSRSGISALALSILVTAIFVVRRNGRRSVRAALVGYLAIFIIVVIAWAGADAVVARFSSANWNEFNDRRGAWTDAAGVLRAFPLAGTGLNTYGVAALLYQRHDLSQHYAQAHNDYLQLAAEGGLLLVVPAVICVALFLRDVRRRFVEDRGRSTYWIRAGAVTALLAIALQETVEFSLQMPGNAALFAVVCGIALHRSPPRRVNAGAIKSSLSVVRI